MLRVSMLVLVAVLPLPVRAGGLKSTAADGIVPLGVNGKPLNLDFETGDLKDWIAVGDAFKNQPIKGDTVKPRRGDMASQHQGNYWIGGYERVADKPQGTLTSAPFVATQPWASFLVGGGPWKETCVELVRKDTGETFARHSGLEEENLRRVAVDLRPHLGKEIFIRLVDQHSGHWGHVNFDDFRFHTEKPAVPERKGPPAVDGYKFAGLAPAKAAAAMTVPEGFAVTLFAGEPDVCQPIAMCLDDRGRVWVAEAYSYPVRRKDGDGKDRILIFEDNDCDGQFDKRTVFMEGLNLVSGLEVGFGGVWIGAAPYLMFVPVKEGEDRPAGKPQILLDSWAYQDTHETLNAFIWGPDGWLYGCHGVFTHSRVGKPGTPDKERIPLNAGVWRYHPTKHVFEVFAHGTSNPWGLDFDAHGQAFVEACVIPHAFHIIQGGRYHRQAGSHFNVHTYDDIRTIADHFHYVGATPHGGNNRSDSAGGGHAHCGLMIYQGGAWPAEFHGKMFMGNIHGHRLNTDVLKPKGSGYVASHGPDLLLANDAWSRFINFRYGPDGNVYVIDWYDKQACHHNDPKIWDRGNGRIYKVSYRGAQPMQNVDLSKLSTKELIALQTHENEWFVRHARRILQERHHLKGDLSPWHGEHLASREKLLFEHKDATRRLRGLWLYHVLDGFDDVRALKLFADPSPHVRAWAIQSIMEKPRLSEKIMERLVELAEKDPSPVVRRYLASAAPRLPVESRWELLRKLIGHPEDAADPNLPLLAWYAAEPLADADAGRALHLASHSELPQTLSFMARRIASAGTPEALAVVSDRLAATDNIDRQRQLLRGFQAGLKGRRQAPMPASWPEAFKQLAKSTDAEVRSLAQAVAVSFGDAAAFAEMRRVLMSGAADMAARQSALAALLDAHAKDLAADLHKLVDDKALRGAAIRGLGAYDDAKTPDVLVKVFASLSTEEKRDALNTLAARVGYGKALMEALAARKIAAADVPAEIVRQLRNLSDKALDARIAEVWGIVRSTPAERVKVIAQWKKTLNNAGPAPDLSLGRAVFAKTCQQCHTLYGVGAKVSPDLTGSNRANLDYLLENILDPSAVIPNDYKVTVLALTSGRVVTGIVRGETPAALTVVTANETLTLPIAEVDTRAPSSSSLMPDDLLKPLNVEEVRALVAYLREPNQVPLLATADNVRHFFNGKDLTGWDGDPKLWSVQDGDIVGKSPGLKRNEFLRSELLAGDFRLTLKVKLTPNTENSGIQFRSAALADGDMKGPQADVGAGWWGKLYEEHGRGLLWDKSGEQHVKPGEWNDYEIVADGSRVRTFINGKACVDLDDPALPRRGIFALQLHSGGAFEVRFKDLRLEVLSAPATPSETRR